MTKKETVLVKEYRGAILENKHCGHICVVNKQGNIVLGAGNPQHITYMRSCAKPLQALAFLALGLDEKYGLTNEEIAIIAGSHGGAEYHIAALESIAKKTNISEDALVLLPTYPLGECYKNKIIANGGSKRKFYHNCAGKHLATIAMAREFSQPDNSYYQPNTPAQNYLLHFISKITSCPLDEIIIGIDGCGVPVYGMALPYMASAFLQVATCSFTNNSTMVRKATLLAKCIHENPNFISRENYICTLLNQDENILAKGGADGIYCFALKQQGLAVSFKIQDGSESSWPIIVREILLQLGYCNATAEKLLNLHPNEMRNATDAVVGEYRPAFKLHKFEGNAHYIK